MEIPKMSWATFTARRRLDVRAWCDRHNIEKYEDLVKKCDSMEIEPPSRSEVLFLVSKSKLVASSKKKETISEPELPKQEAVEEIVEEKEEPKPTKKTSKRGRRKKTAVDTSDSGE